ncbi:MAG: Bax inhibitor-1/YccA family protein [Lachnospiraceae bacterium]|nr:Bax inhibitor-1/YccA family protein [Lachnospiraceae bacterium]
MEQNEYKDYEYDKYDTSMIDSINSSAYQAVDTVQEILKKEVVAKSFLYMMAALAVTAIAAFAAPSVLSEWLMRGRYNLIILFVAELAIVIVSNIAVSKNNVPLTAILFTVYSYLTGSLLGILFWMYDLSSVGAVFLMTAAMFGITAIYGMVTKKDLSSVGSICFMGIIGIIIASLVNAFLIRNGIFDFIISVVGVVIFVALTAYDIQKISKRARYVDDSHVQVMALSGAFELYLDFINIFLRLLRIFGKRN